jgi:hypothetical protein
VRSHTDAAFPRIVIILIVLLLGGMACNVTDQFIRVVTATPEGEPAQDFQGTPATSPADTPAASSANQATPLASPTISHQATPVEPGPANSTIDDRSSQAGANNGSASAESWQSNILERPFQIQSMIYLPQLDLDQAAISLGEQWLFASIRVHQQPPAEPKALYGIELDMDVDGRGDWWIAGQSPSSQEWTTEGVTIRHDANGDVGSILPSRADGPATDGDGYEEIVFDSGVGQDPDLAWVRLSSSDPSVIQLALKRSFLAGDASFSWRPFVDGGLQDPTRYDYHDYFSLEQAGSPLIENANYPLKALGSFDNSCAWAVGFTPTGSEPGLCLPPATATPQATATPIPGSIYGLVWWDFDQDQAKDSGEPPETDLTIRLGAGACPSTGFASTSTAYVSYTENYRFSDLPPGTYCLSFSHEADITTHNNPATVQVVSGSETAVNFGLYQELASR